MKRVMTVAVLSMLALPAFASDYGCQVLLCLSNPASNGGPKGVPECVPPINQLYNDLDHGRPFPTCDMAQGSYAQLVSDPYDPCPAPLTPATDGTAVVQGNPQNNGNGFTIAGNAQLSAPGFVSNPTRACVGKALGTCRDCLTDIAGKYPELEISYATVYNTVLWQQWQNPMAIDVYIGNKFYQRIRW